MESERTMERQGVVVRGKRTMESIMDSHSTGVSPSQQSESSVMLRVAKSKGKEKEKENSLSWYTRNT